MSYVTQHTDNEKTHRKFDSEIRNGRPPGGRIIFFRSVFGSSRDSSKCRKYRRRWNYHSLHPLRCTGPGILSEHRSGGPCFYRCCPDISGFHNGCAGHHVISFRWWFLCPVSEQRTGRGSKRNVLRIDGYGTWLHTGYGSDFLLC